jgi:hypothetical protein
MKQAKDYPISRLQLGLWKLMTDGVWQAIAKQAQKQKQLDASSTKQNQRNNSTRDTASKNQS